MMQTYFKMRFRSKETKVVIVLLIIYSSLAYFAPNILSLTAWGENPKFYLANYASFFFWFAALFFVLPLYVVYLQPNENYFSNLNVICRFEGFVKYWYVRVKIAFLDSSLFVLFLYALMLIRAAYFHQFHHYIENAAFFLKSCCIQILAFTLFALLCAFFSTIFNKPILGFTCAYLLYAYDFIASNMGLLPIHMLNAISVRPEDSVLYWLTFLMVAALIMIFTALGPIILNHKNRIQKERL